MQAVLSWDIPVNNLYALTEARVTYDGLLNEKRLKEIILREGINDSVTITYKTIYKVSLFSKVFRFSRYI